MGQPLQIEGRGILPKAIIVSIYINTASDSKFHNTRYMML